MYMYDVFLQIHTVLEYSAIFTHINHLFGIFVYQVEQDVTYYMRFMLNIEQHTSTHIIILGNHLSDQIAHLRT